MSRKGRHVVRSLNFFIARPKKICTMKLLKTRHSEGCREEGLRVMLRRR